MANSPIFQAGELVKMLSHELIGDDPNEAEVISRYEFFIVESAYLVCSVDTYEYSSRTPYFSYTLRNIATSSRIRHIPEHKLSELNDSEEAYIRLLYAQK